MPLGDIVKSKLYLIIFLVLTSGMPMPAQAGIWSSLRNSAIVTAVFGKPAEVNHTAATRLPVVEVKPSIFARMFNFFSWMNFRATQPTPTPEPQPRQPEPVQPTLSPEAAQNLANRLDAMRKEHEAKKLAELAALEENDRITASIREKADSLKLDLEKARREAEHNKKGWNALSNYACEQDKLIESKQQELDAVLQQKKKAESEAAHLKETATQTTEKHINELALLKGQLASYEEFSSSLNKEQLAKAQAEKESLKSQIDRLQKENTDYLHDKHSIATLLREKQLAAETAEQKSQEQIKRLNDHIAQLKREFHTECSLKAESQEELRRVKNSLNRVESDFRTAVIERDSQLQALAIERALKESISYQLKSIESKSASELRELQQKFEAEKKAHDQAKKELERSKEQSSKALSSSLEFNRQLNSKDDDLQKLKKAYEQEISTIQKTIREKNTDLDLLFAKLKREEEQKKEVIKMVTNFEHQMSAVAGRFAALNDRLNGMNGNLENSQQLLTHLRNNLPRVTKTNSPQLQVVVIPTKTEVDESLERIDRNLTEFERQRKLSASPSNIPSIEIHQSNLATGVTPNPVLNRSVTGEIVESFSELPLTPSSSPELIVNGQPNGSESIYQHIQVDPVHSVHKANKGSEYLRQIHQGNFLPALKQKTADEHIEIIESILYRLHQRAKTTKQEFLEGTYVIQDTENFDLYNALMSYVTKVNTSVTGTLSDPLAHVSFNAFAYPRDASHYVRNKSKHRYYGIDMRRSNYTPFKLPNDHAHLLIGFVDQEKRLIFLKPEHKGIYILDGWMGHCGEFITAQCRKPNWIGKSVRALAGLFGYEIWTDDNPLYHKERVPTDFIKQFGLLLAQEQALTLEQKIALHTKAKELGIQTLTDAQIAQSQAFQEMKAAYQQRYDHLENRNGKEVHFNLAELITIEHN